MKRLIIAVAFIVLAAAGALAIMAVNKPDTVHAWGLSPLVPWQLRADDVVIRERVAARWDAMMALDMERVYAFATPAYRKTHDLTHLENQYGGQIHRTGIDIQDVRIAEEDPDSATVTLYLHFNAAGAGADGGFQGRSFVKETWVKRNGQWWYVERQ